MNDQEQIDDPRLPSAASELSAGLDFPTWDEAISGITDSRFVGHQKINQLHTNCTRAGARIMYDRLYVLMKSNVEVRRGRSDETTECPTLNPSP